MSSNKLPARYIKLRNIMGELADLKHAAELLGWDQRTHMPPHGVARRAETAGTLSRLMHQRTSAPATRKLLDALTPWAETLGPDSDEAAVIRVMRRSCDKAAKLPPELVESFARAVATSLPAWQEAKSKNDWEIFKPHLAALLELNRRKAQALGFKDSPYDALLDEFEEGLTASAAQKIFSDLKAGILPVYKEILQRQDRVPDGTLSIPLDTEKQRVFLDLLARALGMDFNRSRQDLSAHPFTCAMSVDDVRITTHTFERAVTAGIFGTIHECGHAFYIMGIDRAYDRGPLAEGASLGIHESQSRLWENIIGRSRPFSGWLLKQLETAFPEFGTISPDKFYNALNRVSPSDIRVEADEVTYNLHILLRFELEKALVEGSLSLDDAPAAWNAKMKEYLGREPENNASGILQDIHWSLGMFGYFPTYTLGNVMSAQFYDKMISELGPLDADLARGDFSRLRGWLGDRIHRHGAKYPPGELLKRVTGEGLNVNPFVEYLRGKYSAIYGF